MGYIYVEDIEQTFEAGQPSVQLTGTDGNVFALIGECTKAMKKYQREIDPTYNASGMAREMRESIFRCGSYDEALRIMMSFCDVH